VDRSVSAVVYVHGLWMRGIESALLRRRLQHARGYRLYVLRYDSMRESVSSIVAKLQQLITRIDAPRVHLLGHSLGGLIILRYLQRFRMAPPGRVVFLGTPCGGSNAARRFGALRLGRWRLGRRALGLAACEELLEDLPRRWEIDRELGIIAGTRPVGMGQLLLTFRETNDGVVTVSEADLSGATDRLRLPVSHSGMLLSARVATEVGKFFEHGRFGP
jgi:pimeloyl-ACP methyl ester carboxylesterase